MKQKINYFIVFTLLTMVMPITKVLASPLLYDIVEEQVDFTKGNGILEEYVGGDINPFDTISGSASTNDGTNDPSGTKGVWKYNGVESSDGGNKNIYYYRGPVTNNNVVFANACWKIVRTTATGGTKLSYYGPVTKNKEIIPIDPEIVSNESEHPFTYDESTKRWTSGNQDVNESSSEIIVKVTESGEYILSLKVSTEEDYDEMNLYIGNSLYDTYSGEVEENIELNLSAGDTIRLNYTKDTSDFEGDDQVSFILGTPSENVTYSCDTNDSGYQLGVFQSSSSNYKNFYVLNSNPTENFRETAENQLDSRIKINLEGSWFSNYSNLDENDATNGSINAKNYALLEDHPFCVDRRQATTSDATTYSDLQLSSGTYYAGYIRANNTHIPALDCSENDILTVANHKLNKKVGLLTVDEYMLAGGVYSSDGSVANRNIYLGHANNTALLSPLYNADTNNDGNDEERFFVTSNRGTLSEYGAGFNVSTTPVVSLANYVGVINGDGTASNPYIVDETYTITINDEEQGNVTISNENPSNGEEITIEITPDEGYKIKKVTINNVDITESLEDNKYTIANVVTNQTIKVEYEAIEYTFVAGINQTFANADLIIKCDGPLALLDTIKVNDVVLNSSNYELESGSTIVKLKKNYLNSLANDTYTIKLEYKNGSIVSTTFTINKQIPSEEEAQNPNQEAPIESPTEEPAETTEDPEELPENNEPIESEEPKQETPTIDDADDLEESPKTSDNIYNYIILGATCFIGMLITGAYLKNKMDKCTKES